MTASKPTCVAATALRISCTSHSSLTRRRVDRKAASSSSASASVEASAPSVVRAASSWVVSSRSASRTTRTVTSPASLAAASANSSMWRAVRPSSASMSSMVGRAPTQNSP